MPLPAASVENDQAHFASLIALDERERWGIKYLYDRLGIIDNKTSSLLRFNGVAMGFLAILASRILERHELVANPRALLVVAMIALLLFGFAEYQALKIFWLQFDRIGPGRSVGDYKEAFFDITCKRENYYRQAFRASCAAAVAFFIVILWMIVPYLIAAVPDHAG